MARSDGVVANNYLILYNFPYHLPLRVLTPSSSPVVGGEQPPRRRRIQLLLHLGTPSFFRPVGVGYPTKYITFAEYNNINRITL